VRVVEYDPSRRADVAVLMERVWGERPSDEELAWFYERSPVRPASVLIGEEDGKTAGSVAMSFLRMSIGGEALEVGMPVRLATDPDFQGRGIFSELETANEERARALGIRLLLIVPNAASTPAPACRETALLSRNPASARRSAPGSSLALRSGSTSSCEK